MGPDLYGDAEVEALDDKGKTPVQEMQDKANKTMIDIQVDENTGEVMNPEALPVPEESMPEEAPFVPGF